MPRTTIDNTTGPGQPPAYEREEEKRMKTYIRVNRGFHVGQDLGRVSRDTPITLAPDEYARDGHVIGYIPAMTERPEAFLRIGNRHGLIRVHVAKDCIFTE